MGERYEVIWKRAAVRDLDEILEYIAEDRGIDRALQVHERVRRSIASLAAMPRRCCQVPELRKIGPTEHREVVDRPYRINFRITDHEVVLLGILDSRRNLAELLIQRAIEQQNLDRSAAAAVRQAARRRSSGFSPRWCLPPSGASQEILQLLPAVCLAQGGCARTTFAPVAGWA